MFLDNCEQRFTAPEASIIIVIVEVERVFCGSLTFQVRTPM